MDFDINRLKLKPIEIDLKVLPIAEYTRKRMADGYPEIVERFMPGKEDPEKLLVIRLYGALNKSDVSGHLMKIVKEEAYLDGECGSVVGGDPCMTMYVEVSGCIERQRQICNCADTLARWLMGHEDSLDEKFQTAEIDRKELFTNYLRSEISWDADPERNCYVIQIPKSVIASDVQELEALNAFMDLPWDLATRSVNSEGIEIQIFTQKASQEGLKQARRMVEGDLLQIVLNLSEWRDIKPN